MEEEDRNDLRIAGSNTVGGGTFNRVKIAGQGDINGDLDCSDFKVSGSGDVRGNLKAGTVRVSGSATVHGDIKAGEVKISGSFSSRGKAAAEKFGVSGSLTTKGDCEAESFVVRGAVSIRGMLNAENIDIRQYGGISRAGEIGCEKVSIRVPGPFGLQKILKLFHPAGKFVAETIEADEIYLEYTRARVVRGNNVSLGPGCEIELVNTRMFLSKTRMPW